MKFSDLQTPKGFSNFLQQYHQKLEKDKSFPSLGNIKALNAASPIFGFKDWNAMAAISPWSEKDNRVSDLSVSMFFIYMDAEITPEEAGHDRSAMVDGWDSKTLVFDSFYQANLYLWNYLAFNLKRMIKEGTTFLDMIKIMREKHSHMYVDAEVPVFILEYVQSKLERIIVKRAINNIKKGKSEGFGAGVQESIAAIDAVEDANIGIEDFVDQSLINTIEALTGVVVHDQEEVLMNPSFKRG